MPLDPQVRRMRDQRERDGTPALYTMSLAEARVADLASVRAAGGDPEPVPVVTDRSVPGPDGDLPIRIYRSVAGPEAPALIYFFGGGWTLGSIDTADGVCRSLANLAGCVVVAVGYRLAPEHRFPAAVHDCSAATEWISTHAREFGVDPARIAVGGDSAGGNLAAAVTLLTRGRVDLVGQLLVYPNTDYGSDTASMRDNVDPVLFNRASVGWYWGHYLAADKDGLDPLASPLRAPDLTGLPPAFVITAEYDPLRDEGEAYARRLAEAGVAVTHTRYEGMVHGFYTAAGTLDAARDALRESAHHLRSWFGTLPR